MKIKDKRPFYHEGLQFECTRCGGCCSGFPGYVWLSEPELERLSTNLGLDRTVFISRYTKVVRGFGPPRISLVEKQGFDCIFFDYSSDPVCTDRVCKVYDARPYQCSSYPFWKKNLVYRSDWDRTARFCPGLNRGRTYSREEIEDFLSYFPEYNIRRFSQAVRRELGF
jgi:Fe-S-cluster containining protein